MEDAGRKLRAESYHELFPDKPVQTCQGMFGPYGEHPSRICDRIEFSIKSQLTLDEMDKAAKKGMDEYIREYGERDHDVSGYFLEFEQGSFQLNIPGSSGHMGASLHLDNAIVKASYIMKRIYENDKNIELRFPNVPDMQIVVLEGGQGFLPSHTLIDVEKMVTDAVLDAVSQLENPVAPEISFDKLHNSSFSGDPRSEAVNMAVFSAGEVGISVKMPLSGFPVSCDARLFANTSGKETLTVGPGKLEDAHSNREKMDIHELASSSAFLALYVLIQTGAIGMTDHS